MAGVDCAAGDKVTKTWGTEGDSRGKKKKWLSDVADDEEMERQPRRLVCREFYGKDKKVKKKRATTGQ